MNEMPAEIITIARELAANGVNGMCMTMDHSFCLQDEQQQRGLKLSMSQIAEHDVAPAIAKAILAERERCAELTNAMGIREQYNYGLVRSAQNYYRATSAIRQGDTADDHLDDVVRKWNGMPLKDQEVSA